MSAATESVRLVPEEPIDSGSQAVVQTVRLDGQEFGGSKEVSLLPVSLRRMAAISEGGLRKLQLEIIGSRSGSSRSAAELFNKEGLLFDPALSDAGKARFGDLDSPCANARFIMPFDYRHRPSSQTFRHVRSSFSAAVSSQLPNQKTTQISTTSEHRRTPREMKPPSRLTGMTFSHSIVDQEVEGT
ncbi:MAG: hypothetical protein VX399_02415 [SAR324 cluster bacterium]|nr:hypothetical protein [SAR324 cluster bacterium]